MNPSGPIVAAAPESIFSYKQALACAMEELAAHPDVLFLGQGVQDKGTFMSMTLEGISDEKKLELPVAEEMQMGMSVGLALQGFIPVSIYPRWNFLILAANQLVNHLDKMNAKVIVRVGVGSTKPLYPGPQHTGDFTFAFRRLMPNTHIVKLESATDVISQYRKAIKRDGPTILVEQADLY